MTEVVANMSPIEPEVKEILDVHAEEIKGLKHDVSDIKVNIGRMDERMNGLVEGQKDLKTTLTDNYNAILQSVASTNQIISQLLMNLNDNKTQMAITEDTNDTQLEIAKQNNNTTLKKQGLILFGGLFAGSKLPELWDWFKGFWS